MPFLSVNVQVVLEAYDRNPRFEGRKENRYSGHEIFDVLRQQRRLFQVDERGDLAFPSQPR